MFTFTSDWSSPHNYLWRQATIPLLASRPYFPENEIITEDILRSKIEKLKEYDYTFIHFLKNILIFSVTAFIISGIITAILFSSLTPITSSLLLLWPMIPFSFMSPLIVILTNIDKAREEAENRFHHMRLLNAKCKIDSAKETTASIRKRPMLLMA